MFEEGTNGGRCSKVVAEEGAVIWESLIDQSCTGITCVALPANHRSALWLSTPSDLPSSPSSKDQLNIRKPQVLQPNLVLAQALLQENLKKIEIDDSDSVTIRTHNHSAIYPCFPVCACKQPQIFPTQTIDRLSATLRLFITLRTRFRSCANNQI
jgi:hypothetical protein